MNTRLTIIVAFALSCGRSAAETPIPADARYACPMETHPDEADPQKQGAYFSTEPGRCPLCGMELKPLDEVPWLQVQLAAQGGDIAYTCPKHPHVFSETGGRCPRCGAELKPFKVMYTCPDPAHASVVFTKPGNCPLCGRGLAAFRGIWLHKTMAEANVPPDPGVAEVAAYRCPVHPLVHSDSHGNCTICGQPLVNVTSGDVLHASQRIPADAKYVCPMQECWHFSPVPGECPKCGMKLKPIEQIEWARAAVTAEPPRTKEVRYVCPMHPDKVRSDAPGECSICGMQLVLETTLKRPQAAPDHVAVQMDYIMEHYLELQRRLASDRTAGIALHALGLASAAEELGKHIADPDVASPKEVVQAVEALREAALQTRGTSLESDRVHFVELSAAVRTLVGHFRPDKSRWPKLYLFHCPMSKGDWFQSTADKANPYYGFKRLECGELRGIQ